MNKQERASELRIIVSHISAVKDDLSAYRDRLETAKCTPEAKKLETIIGKLEALQWDIAKKY